MFLFHGGTITKKKKGLVKISHPPVAQQRKLESFAPHILIKLMRYFRFLLHISHKAVSIHCPIGRIESRGWESFSIPIAFQPIILYQFPVNYIIIFTIIMIDIIISSTKINQFNYGYSSDFQYFCRLLFL